MHTDVIKFEVYGIGQGPGQRYDAELQEPHLSALVPHDLLASREPWRMETNTTAKQSQAMLHKYPGRGKSETLSEQIVAFI
jgi:hypothetical protein